MDKGFRAKQGPRLRALVWTKRSREIIGMGYWVCLLAGSFGECGGNGPSSRALHTMQSIQTSWENYLTYSDHPALVFPEEFRSLRLSFSPNLDDYNPDIPEWRRDISRVIKKSLVEVSAHGSFSCPGWEGTVPEELYTEGILRQRNDRRFLEPLGDLSDTCRAKLRDCRCIIDASGRWNCKQTCGH